jgi:hypothetical protein
VTTPASPSAFPAAAQAQIDAQLKLPVTTPDVKGTEPVAAAPAGTTIEKLLTPTKDDPADAYVHFGNLSVDRKIVDDFKKAQTYLAKDPEAVDVLSAMESGKPISVEGITDGNDRFSGLSNTIYWDPNSAMVNADGSKQTAALGLLHEQGHATEFARDPTRFAQNVGTANQRYDTAEEQRNITGLETRAAKVLGEGTRTDHGGTPYNAKGPTSLEPVATPALSGAALRSAIDGERFGLAAHGYAPPPPAGAAGITAWDGKPHTGSILHLDGNTVAQSLGRGQYEVYDVKKDLGGVMPPENDPTVAIDAKGNVTDRAHPAAAHDLGTPGASR